MAAIRLKGMTWDHPRGYDPLAACSALWAERTGVEIAWDRRSLQDFESFPVEELARAYEPLIIDPPHVGAGAPRTRAREAFRAPAGGIRGPPPAAARAGAGAPPGPSRPPAACPAAGPTRSWRGAG